MQVLMVDSIVDNIELIVQQIMVNVIVDVGKGTLKIPQKAKQKEHSIEKPDQKMCINKYIKVCFILIRLH